MSENLLAAVERVLDEADEPLHYQELTRRVLESGLWATEGQTPAATINAKLSTDIKRHGDASRFDRTAPGVFALRSRSASGGCDEVDEPGAPEPAARSADESPQDDSFLTFTDAAERVLSESSDGQPMHYRAITERALAAGLIQTRGLTPEATLIAQLGTEIDRYVRRGQTPRFVRAGRGYFGLTRWQPRGLAYEIEQQNARVRDELHSRLHSLAPAEFEALVGDVLGAIGFAEVTVMGRSGDGGVDVRGTLVVGDVIQTRMAVQVKRWKSNVQTPTVREVRGSLGAHEQGLIITTSGFSAGAVEEARRRDAVPVALMDGKQFVNLLIDNGLGVRRDSHILLELSKLEHDTSGERQDEPT